MTLEKKHIRPTEDIGLNTKNMYDENGKIIMDIAETYLHKGVCAEALKDTLKKFKEENCSPECPKDCWFSEIFNIYFGALFTSQSSDCPKGSDAKDERGGGKIWSLKTNSNPATRSQCEVCKKKKLPENMLMPSLEYCGGHHFKRGVLDERLKQVEEGKVISTKELKERLYGKKRGVRE